MTTLGAVAAAGHGTWSAVTERDLAAALTESGVDRGAHLVAFVAAVRAWLKADRGAAFAWIQRTADPFLHALGADTFGNLAAEIRSPEERVRFLELFFDTGGRSHLSPAAVATAGAIAQDTTLSVANAASLAARLLTIAAHATGIAQSDAIVGIFRPLSRDCRIELLARIGQVRFFSFESALVAALIALPQTADEVATVLARSDAAAKWKSLLSEVGTFLAARRTYPPGPPAATVRAWWAGVRVALGELDAHAQARAHGFVVSIERHDTELAQIVGLYLDTRPPNHEDVFDFLTSHAEQTKRPPPAPWGRPTVTTSTASSMKRNTAKIDDKRRWEPVVAPDFPAKDALARVSLESSAALVTSQARPEYSVTYLARLIDAAPTRRGKLVERAMRDAHWRAMLAATDGRAAASVYSQVERIAMVADAPAGRALRDELFEKLLPRIPSGALEHLGLLFLNEQQIKFAVELLEERLKNATTLAEAAESLNVFDHTGIGDRQAVHLLIDAARIAPAAGATIESLRAWLRSATMLASSNREAAEYAATGIAPEVARAMLSTNWFTPAETTNHWWASQLLFVKALLLRKLDRVEATAKATETRNDDATLVWTARPAPPRPGPAGVPATLVDAWLDLLVDLNAELADAVLVALLDAATTNDVYHPLEPTTRYVSYRLQRASREAPEEFWAVLERKLASATDIDAVSSLGAVSLAASPDRLHRYRELAVSTALPFFGKPGTIFWSPDRPLGAFATVLTTEDPDLAARLRTAGQS